MPRWVFMWTMALALFAGCKWLTYAQVRSRIGEENRRRMLGYLIAWPGMDADAFLSRTNAFDRPSRSEWAVAGLKTMLGAIVIWVFARAALPQHPLLAGWVGMVGAIFVLHFGTFHLLSLGWRSVGVDAMPLMRNPMRSTSLAEFWGRRWNTAFHELAARFTFKPLRPSVGVTAATLATFVASGLIHELVISVPAGGGYGLPTGYFVLQGLGLAGERSGLGRRLGLGRGWRGWLYTVLATAGPAFWLFPPPFVHNVILPMLGVIGAV
jgi:Membrane bound O-acyl transferase family